ncbi:tRNA pseudouridine(38-40) synthase TruA [Oceanivirga miroungae]|uniref:tRNA pseudouridine synthase A n=1 Tax=Oceanivirga miroungae TaxID=1130046 RepID=A0A6I8M7W0_9FUSO|nr:tRNA pseudouridine(38-40) synthase TruA [Oceanivirga miroungae]VWL84920.1 tRNA pseudouridine synthase A [Oceanivirga miroungae]
MEIKITYSYDGSHFHGMQRQKNKITVQGEIEKVLKSVFNEDIHLISSGRTDRHVHALAQVSSFTIKKNIPLEAIKRQLNSSLFGKIRVIDIKEVNDFHPRFHAKKRVYEYRFKFIDDISPFEARYISAISYKNKLDLEKINKNLSIFIGIHNFKSFSKFDKDQNLFVREIYNAYCYIENNTYIAIIEGSGFLKSQIRLMMASCIFEDEEKIRKRLNLELESIPKKIVSPYGLYLKEVIYD